MANVVQSVVESLVKKTSTSINPSENKKGNKLHFSPEVVEVYKKPITKVVAKKFPMEQTPEQPTKVLDIIVEGVISDGKDDIFELHEQLKKAQLIIA